MSWSPMPSAFREILRITIPSEHENQIRMGYARNKLEDLSSQLKYLETPECRATLSKEAITKERADVTLRFKSFLAFIHRYSVDVVC